MQVELIVDEMFPCLGFASKTPELIVLFSKESKGTVLTPVSDSFPLGMYREDWKMEEFVLFDGKVVLSN